MLRAAVVVSFLVLLVAAGYALAAASITTANLSGSPSYTGPCPTTMVFKGTVNGTAGTTFRLTFSRFINGAQQLADVGIASIPAAAALR